MAPIDRIVVKGFKSIKELDLKLGPLNILIGANGSGKSNLIGVFELLRNIFIENLGSHVARSGGADRFLHYGRKNTEELQIVLGLDYFDYECKLIPGTDMFVFEDEKVKLKKVPSKFPEKPHILQMFGGTNHKESHFREWKSKTEHLDLFERLQKQWKLYHLNDASESAKVKTTCDINDNRFLRSDGSNIAAYLYMIEQTSPQHYRNIVDTIRLVAPFFGDFILEPDRLNEKFIKLEWRERGSDQYFDASSFSDGTLRFICLATLLMQPDHSLPQTIIIDEPELGLHPYALNLVAEMIKSASTKVQLIVSTQSAGLVSQFDPEEIIVVDRENGESMFKRLSSDELSEWLEEYDLGELWEKNVFGGTP